MVELASTGSSGNARNSPAGNQAYGVSNAGKDADSEDEGGQARAIQAWAPKKKRQPHIQSLGERRPLPRQVLKQTRHPSAQQAFEIL